MTADQVAKEEDEKMVKVKFLSKTHVKPNKPIGRRECQLTTYDLFHLAFYHNQKLLVYKGGHSDFEGTVQRLKDGLGVVLDEFYQLAGKLGKDEDGIFTVEYDDNMDGVEVVAAAAEEIEVADLIVEEDTSKLKELVPYNGILNLEGLRRPLVAVQLTKLRDGIAMGCAFNHAIVDGTSTWHFMGSWAEICSGASQFVSVPPFLERTKARNTRVKLNLNLPLDAPQNSSTSTGHVTSPGPPVLREKIFKFSDSSIDQIKSKHNSNPSDDSKPFSTFQCLTTHVWRAVTRARRLRPEEITVLTVFADCRKRVDPPMPQTYFGNLSQAIQIGSTAGLLTTHPPVFVLTKVQKAIEMHDSKVIEARNAEQERDPKIFQLKDAGVNGLVVGSSPRFNVYAVDFGWGKPERVRGGPDNKFDGMVYLFQGKSGGRSIDVEICLEANAMDMLEKDNEFLI